MEENKELDTRTRRKAHPACCDIYEEDGNIILKMEMPGVTKENLDINVEGDTLTIEGRRVLDDMPQGEYLIREIRDADFYQKYTVDETIDRNKIDASLSDGILTLTLGIKETEKPKKINVVTK